MNADVGQRSPGIELTALYRRRSTIRALIHAMERYQRVTVRPASKCSQGTFRCRPVRPDYAE